MQTPQKQPYEEKTEAKQADINKPKKKRNPWLIGCLSAVGGAILLIVIIAIISTANHTNLDPNYIVNKNAIDIATKLSDFPANEKGWRIQQENKNIDKFPDSKSVYAVDFYREIHQGFALVQEGASCQVVVYATVDIAKNQYKGSISKISADVKEPSIGDEAVHYADNLIFRKNNVIIELFVPYYVGDIQEMAKLCADRIN